MLLCWLQLRQDAGLEVLHQGRCAGTGARQLQLHVALRLLHIAADCIAQLLQGPQDSDTRAGWPAARSRASHPLRSGL